MRIMRSGLFVLFVLAAGVAYGQVPSAKGMGEVTYSGWQLGNKSKNEALKNAKVNAIERYVAGGSVSKSKNFDLIRDKVQKNPEAFLLGYSTVSEDHDDDAKRYKVVIRAEINKGRLEQAFQDASAVGNASDAEKSYITFVFVARQQAAVKSYDAKKVKRKDTETYVEGSDKEVTSEQGAEYAGEQYKSEKTTTGGSTTKKSDVVKYKVSTAQGINSKMTQVFSTTGFQVVDAAYLEGETGGLISLDAFKNDYRTGSDISASTKRDAAKGAQMVDIPYIALGTLDVGMTEKDSVSGLDKVYVTVNGKVLDVQNRFPKAVASVGPVQYAGTGPSQTVAKNNALKKAAEAAAQNLTEQLNARGVK